MSTTVSIQGQVLAAMAHFVATPKSFRMPSALSSLLLEITPDSVRLVATDSHVLGILHLTAMNAYGMTVECCDAPIRLLLPIEEFAPLLRDHRASTLTLTTNGAQVTIRNAAGLQIPVQGRDAADYPQYRRIIPQHGESVIAGFSVDTTLLIRFNAFAKTLRVEPHIALRFHAETKLISIYLKHLSSFYGLLAPYQDEGRTAQPTWLLPAEPRHIHLRTFDRMSGHDADGLTWVMFQPEEETVTVPGPCAICGHRLQTGWLCLDTGEAVCTAHVTLPVAECLTHRTPHSPGKEVPPVYTGVQPLQV